jgi:hypothetical protein
MTPKLEWYNAKKVYTMVASIQDVETTAIIQKDLAQHDLLPDE